jgi:hypothetical protein
VSWVRDEPRKVWSWHEHGQAAAEVSDETLCRAGQNGKLWLAAIETRIPPDFTTGELYQLLAIARQEVQ